jgi:dolichol kinase
MAELVARTEGLQPWRRVLHAAFGSLVALGLHVLGSRVTALLSLAVILGAQLILDASRLAIPGFNRRFFRWLRVFASPREERRLASSTWYVLGIGLVVALFPLAIAVPSVLVLALADPSASYVGRRWGRTPLGKGSVLGTSVFVALAFAILLAFVSPLEALATASVVALVEVLPLPLDDNLTVPVAAGASLWLLALV